MSSGGLPRAQHPDLFHWSDQLDPAHYLRARYRITSNHGGEATAMGMAMEQSAATTHIHGYVEPSQLTDHTIRVVSVAAAESLPPSELTHYQLATEVYAHPEGQHGEWRIELAIPLKLVLGKPAQLFNVVVGELPRLGFLTRFQLEHCTLPDNFGPGPGFGIAGIRERLGRPRGPLLCRSMRPAVGLDTATMTRLNLAVLTGGFHMVKDDELQVFADNTVFRQHVQAMLAARDLASAQSGERKAYLANLICEPDELAERWDICTSLGVDAVLVAPSLQGFGTLSLLARQRALPILSHNTFTDLMCRHPHWGIAHSVMVDWQEAMGADWFVTEGGFADTGTDTPSKRSSTRLRTAMPIIQGGKHPAGLPLYRRSNGDDDFMMIVASWVDAHAEGLEQAARIFRAAVDDAPAVID